MAISRVVNTSFWKDNYIVDLETDERLLFLYFLTNPQTNIAGIYELSVREMAFDTSIDKKRIEEIIQKFVRDHKIFYINGWLALNNWIKHQQKNPKVSLGIQRIISELPDWLQKELLEPEDPQSSLLDDSLSKPIYSQARPIALNLTKLNLTKPNGTDESDGPKQVLSKSQKRQYAISMQKERESDERAKAATTRSRTKPVPVVEATERQWR